MSGMKKNILFLLFGVLAVAGCQRDEPRYIYSDYDDQYDAEYFAYLERVGCAAPGIDVAECVRRANPIVANDTVKEIKFSMPHGNDLRLETAEYVLQIDAVPGKKYDYYVWTGDKSYADDPDLIVQDGDAAVLIER